MGLELKESFTQKSIGREEAVRLGKSEWWVNTPDIGVCLFQLETEELCMPIGELYATLERVLGYSPSLVDMGFLPSIEGLIKKIRNIAWERIKNGPL